MCYLVTCNDCKHKNQMDYGDLLIFKEMGYSRVHCKDCFSENVKVEYL